MRVNAFQYLLAGILASWAAPGLAQSGGDWMPVKPSSSMSEAAINLPRVRKHNYQPRTYDFWVRTVPDVAKFPKGKIAHTMVLYSGDCANRTLATLSVNEYDKSGAAIKSARGSSLPDPVVPYSFGEEVLDSVCGIFDR